MKQGTALAVSRHAAASAYGQEEPASPAGTPAPSAWCDAAERERLIIEHLPQVRLIARKIHDRLPACVVLDDLVSAGILGLISALDRYDPSQNVKLRTYAEYKIRGAILDSLRDLDWSPRKLRQRSRQIEQAISLLEQKLGRAPTELEIAGELEIDLPTYQQWLAESRSLSLSSLDTGGRDESGRTPILTLADETESPLSALEHGELRRVLALSIQALPRVERTVISLYYQEGLTLKEIGQIMDLHESRISQLKTQAILRLRSSMAGKWPKRGQ